MRFLCVAERELRAGARQKRTHHVRWITAAAFFALLVWLIWVFDGFRAPQIFKVFSALTFFYCVIMGTTGTADCLSSEKREGTMGLLFLTNLNGSEIIGGKLCSSALTAAYGLFAIFPLLAVQMLVGGITLGHFWRTLLSLGDAIFFAIATGFLASSLCVRQFTAVALATGLAIFFSGGLMAAATIMRAFLRGTRPWIDWMAIFSPLYSFISADSVRGLGWKHYWWSILAVAGISLMALIIATLRVSLSWRDRPTGVRIWSGLKVLQFWRQRGSAGRTALRRRLLTINPFFWLAGRNLVSSPVFMVLTVILVVCVSLIAAPYFARTLTAGQPMVGQVFAWLWTALVIHALVLYYGAMVASQRVAEDKQTGALELVLSTPTSIPSISRGLWMAYGRRMLFPAVIAILVHCFFVWQVATLAVLDPPGRIPSGMTAGQLLWHALLNRPMGGLSLEWGFILAMRIAVLSLALLMMVWFTLGWVARWMGLRMKRPGFAPFASLALVLAPPVVLFSFACYCVARWHLDRLPARMFVPLMMWLAFGLAAGHYVILSVGTAWRLRTAFRAIVTSRFQPPPIRPWWRPAPRSLLRVGVAGITVVLALLIITLSFYGYQNWRSRRAWSAFQKELRQKNESLDMTALLPGPVPDSGNFALTRAFQNWANPTDIDTATMQLVRSLSPFCPSYTSYGTVVVGTEWARQALAPMDQYATSVSGIALPRTPNRTQLANAVPQGLKPREASLQALATAARLPYFQVSTNQESLAMVRASRSYAVAFEELHLLFQMRACALLVTNRSADAADDVLTGLQLVRLSRQQTDALSVLHTQTMLDRSLQPIWEGMVQRKWTVPQLARFQDELGKFNLLADYTNAVRRAVLANIAVWQQIANDKSGHSRIPAELRVRDGWQVQPRAWWLENCIELYRVGQDAIGKVDVPGAHVRVEMSPGDLSGLTLDSETTLLLQQPYWLGASPTLVVFVQTAVNEAIIACALERFRLVTGKYPENLEQLIPEYLQAIPNDVVRGRPMLYQNPGDGRFILRSVGPNGVDDRKNPASDDWLWSFPTNAPPAAVAPAAAVQ